MQLFLILYHNKVRGVMFKKRKKVVYKSANTKEAKNEITNKIVALVICVIATTLSICFFIFTPLENVQLPQFYLSNFIWAIILFAILVTSGISLMLITNQGANKKLFIYFSLCCALMLTILIFSHIFHLLLVALFLSLLLLYFAFLAFHELRKTNLTAYYLFIPFVLFSIYNVVVYYFITMLN